MSHKVAMNFPLEREAIMGVLPHRDPMLFIDTVLSASETSLKARTRVNTEWPVFKGHFPDMPIMPGVLLIETVAQAGSLIWG